MMKTSPLVVGSHLVNTVFRPSLALAALLAASLAALSLPAEAGGRHGGHGHRWHGHHRHHHHHHPGVVLGIGLGFGAAALWHHHHAHAAAAWGPAPVYVVPPVAYAYAEPAPALPRAPDPVIYPRQGQSPAQTEADRQACNRWATTQPGAMAEASVFHRATIACMEGRGYTVR